MKISLLLPDLRGGGAERISLSLAHEFSREGHEIEFVLMRAEGEFLEEAKCTFKVFDLSAPRIRALPLALTHYIRNERPDALISAMWPLTVIAPFAQRLSRHRCKVLVAEHIALSRQYGDKGLLYRMVMRASMNICYRLSDFRVGVSSGVVADIATLSGLHSDLFNTVYNPIPPQLKPSLKALQNAELLWSNSHGVRIVNVGSLKTQKNQSLLLRAFAKLDQPKAKLMIVGEGEERKSLQSLCKELGVVDRVIFAGFQTNPSSFYYTADLFVLSSDYEGLPTVLLEALSAGLPIVSTDCPSGPSEILEQGKYGQLVPVGDEKALAKAMERALDTPVDKDALKRRAADFAPEIAARKYLELLEM